MFNEKTWKEGEALALQYLKDNGYKILYTNFSCAGVELDIVSEYSAKLQIKKLKEEFDLKVTNELDKQKKKTLKRIFENLKKDIVPLLVITEVKARATENYGKGYESVGYYKKQNIKRGAFSLLKNPKFEGYQIRFDVASVDSGILTYYENAF